MRGGAAAAADGFGWAMSWCVPRATWAASAGSCTSEAGSWSVRRAAASAGPVAGAMESCTAAVPAPVTVSAGYVRTAVRRRTPEPSGLPITAARAASPEPEVSV